jgi:hypothetical protein
VPAQNTPLAAAIGEWSIPHLTYKVIPGTFPADTGRVLRKYAPYLIDFAQGVEMALKSTGARLVVVPEGNSAEDEIVNRVARKLGMNTACLQQGWSPIVHPGFRNLSYTEMLVWGQGFADLLQPFNPAQHFSCVGNYQLPTASHSANSGTGVLFFFQGFDNWLGGRASAEAMLALAERLAGCDTGVPVYLRPHPSAPFPSELMARIASKPNLIVEPGDRVSLAEALAKAKVSVSTYSTTILESVAAGVVPIIFNTTTMPKYWPDVDAAKAGIEIRDLDSAETCILNLLKGPSGTSDFLAPMQALADQFFCARAEAALENICTRLKLLAAI